MAKKKSNQNQAPKKQSEAPKAAEEKKIEGSGDPAEEEGDNDDAPEGGEGAAENNLTEEQVAAQRAINDRLEAVQAAFGGTSFEVYDDEDEDPQNPFVSIKAEDGSDLIEAELSELERIAEHVPALLDSFEGAKFVGIGSDARDDGETPIVILDEEGNTLSEGSLEELLEQAAELLSTAIQDRVQAVIDFHKGKDVQLPEAVDMDKPEEIEITLTTEAGETLTKKLGDFEADMKAAADAQAENKPAKTSKKRASAGDILEDFKIRNMPWRPTNVLRATKDFQFQEHSFKKGEVFDWYGLGLHRLHVKRLFAQRLVRHVVEDMGTIYPFKTAEKKVKKGNKSDLGWDRLPDHLKSAKKTDAPESNEDLGEYDDSEEREKRLRLLNREKHGMGGGKDELDDGKGNYGGPRKKNFSIKGDLRDR